MAELTGLLANHVIGQRFRTLKRLGSGSFGEIFIGIDATSGNKVAMKFEKHGLRCPQLRHEYKVYRELQACRGICKCTYYGTHDDFNVMVLELLGPSLEELFTSCGRKFTLKTTLKLADQLLERVDALHSRHLIHRDIKPANFVMGDSRASSLVYCIDFGLSKRYRNPTTLQHIPHRMGKSLTGTPRYASISNHLGEEQSRRDDLEAIGYVLIYFVKGRLPWQGLKAKTAHRKYKLILEKKREISIEQLCHGCPPHFAEYLSYCRSLGFDAEPNISYLRGLFRNLWVAHDYGDVSHMQDNDWDWTPRLGASSAPHSSDIVCGSSGSNVAEVHSRSRGGAPVGDAGTSAAAAAAASFSAAHRDAPPTQPPPNQRASTAGPPPAETTAGCQSSPFLRLVSRGTAAQPSLEQQRASSSSMQHGSGPASTTRALIGRALSSSSKGSADKAERSRRGASGSLRQGTGASSTSNNNNKAATASSRGGSSRYELRRPRTAQPTRGGQDDYAKPVDARWGARVAGAPASTTVTHHLGTRAAAGSSSSRRPASAHAASRAVPAADQHKKKDMTFFESVVSKPPGTEPTEEPPPVVAGARGMMAMACRNGSTSTRRRLA